jgi:hypothetical protein
LHSILKPLDARRWFVLTTAAQKWVLKKKITLAEGAQHASFYAKGMLVLQGPNCAVKPPEDSSEPTNSGDTTNMLLRELLDQMRQFNVNAGNQQTPKISPENASTEISAVNEKNQAENLSKIESSKWPGISDKIVRSAELGEFVNLLEFKQTITSSTDMQLEAYMGPNGLEFREKKSTEIN